MKCSKAPSQVSRQIYCLSCYHLALVKRGPHVGLWTWPVLQAWLMSHSCGVAGHQTSFRFPQSPCLHQELAGSCFCEATFRVIANSVSSPHLWKPKFCKSLFYIATLTKIAWKQVTNKPQSYFGISFLKHTSVKEIF